MATETLYATSHITGSFVNPTNANGNTPSTWAGELNTNTSATSRWAIGDPTAALLSTTQTVNVRARKGSNSNNPDIQVNLYENGTLVQSVIATTAVTSTTGQTLTGTFNGSVISNQNNVEIEVVMSAAGGSPSARNSAQVAYIEVVFDVVVLADSLVVPRHPIRNLLVR